MAQFDEEIALAAELILENGEQSTYRRRVEPTPPDPTKPWKVGTDTAADTDTTVSAVWLDEEAVRRFGSTLIPGTVLTEKQQLVLVPGSALGTLVPSGSTDSLIRANGEKWSLEKINTLNPNGQIILHTFVVEK